MPQPEIHPVWYMAHPVAPDDKYTLAQNMDHVVHLTRLFFDEGVYVCTPYHSCIMALDDNNIQHRRMGIEMDFTVLRKLERVICVGHKLSSGMEAELNLIKAMNGSWLNLVGFDDYTLREFCKAHSRKLTGL